ncbi:hypothetical protein L6164_017714 [Bauhinia variegata]|uniref:Uncharacterized protein n=1 Tax=Bauhinia variegata TaxID=167791 RepID=A0ACB9NC98_BAUVA|nr:hypothetical protein L6164_017714 [Bauhinia variegata]
MTTKSVHFQCPTMFIYPMVSLNSSGKYYYVEEIYYADATIRLVDPAFHQQQNYSYLPLYPLSSQYTYDWYSNKPENDEIIYLSCNESVNNDGRYMNTSACVDEQYSESGGYLYNYVHTGDLSARELRLGCTVINSTLTLEGNGLRKGNNISCADIHTILAQGFQLQWFSGCDAYGARIFSYGCDSIWFKILRYVLLYLYVASLGIGNKSNTRDSLCHHSIDI